MPQRAIQVTVPQDAGRNGSPGFPGERNVGSVSSARSSRKPTQPAHGREERDIASGPDIWPAQGHEQVYIGRPGPDAPDPCQFSSRDIVGHTPDAIQIHNAHPYLPGQVNAVGRFLPGDAERSQAIDTGRLQFLGSNRDEGLLDAPVYGRTGREGNLLLENDTYEGGKARHSRPEWWVSVSANDGRKVGVGFRQKANRLDEPGAIQAPENAVVL